MIPITITPNIDQAPWTDLKHVPQMGTITRIGRLPHGTKSGASTVTVCIEMPDGTQVLAQTTLALFLAAARAIEAREAQENQGNQTEAQCEVCGSLFPGSGQVCPRCQDRAMERG